MITDRCGEHCEHELVGSERVQDARQHRVVSRHGHVTLERHVRTLALRSYVYGHVAALWSVDDIIIYSLYLDTLKELPKG